jgi:hypothetical protein
MSCPPGDANVSVHIYFSSLLVGASYLTVPWNLAPSPLFAAHSPCLRQNPQNPSNFYFRTRGFVYTHALGRSVFIVPSLFCPLRRRQEYTYCLHSNKHRAEVNQPASTLRFTATGMLWTRCQLSKPLYRRLRKLPKIGAQPSGTSTRKHGPFYNLLNSFFPLSVQTIMSAKDYYAAGQGQQGYYPPPGGAFMRMERVFER